MEVQGKMNEEIKNRIKILEERIGKSHQRLLRHENACKPQGSEEDTGGIKDGNK